MYQIKNWEKHFEVAQSKRVEGPLNWVPVPTKHDSLAFRRIMALEDGMAIFGAWILILEIAAKCPVRGTLGELSESGPIEYGPGELAMMTGCPSILFQRALDVLTTTIIGWVIVDSSEKALSALGERSETTHLQEKTVQDNTEQDRTEQVASRGKPRQGQPTICDSEYLRVLQAKAAYADLNVDLVYGKLVAWCELKGKQPTRSRLLNWLNREDRPLNGANEKFSSNRGANTQPLSNPVPKPTPVS